MSNHLLEAALSYAAKGWRVFPVFHPDEYVDEHGKRGKTPRTPNGFNDGSTSEFQIKKWWNLWPRSNIGVCTGAAFVVLDIDSAAAEAQLEALDYEVPESLQVRTGRGRHVYFKGDSSIRNRTRLLGQPGVDIRGEGGYVVVPPSLHESGRVYEFENDEVPMAEIPAWMRELHGKKERAKVDTSTDEPISEGGRNDELARIAGSYRSRGMGYKELCALLLDVNKRRCKPPLDEGEVRKIAESIAKYPVEEFEIAQPWGTGWDLDALKKHGADEETLATAAKANDAVKKKLPEPGSDVVRLEIRRKWSKDSSREVELIAKVSYGNASVTVPKLRGHDVLSQDTLAALCYEQGLMLPKMKRADWRKLAAQAINERHDEEITEDETIIGACIVAARDWILSLDETTNWKDFPSGCDRLRYVHKEGMYSVSAKQLRNNIAAVVRDARRSDVSAALRSMGAFRHPTPGGRTMMLRITLEKQQEGGIV